MSLFRLQLSFSPLGIFERKKTMDDFSIKENLCKARESCGLSQSEVSVRLGINRASFIKLEKGRTRILNKQIPALARIYGISVEELLLGYAPLPEGDSFLEDRKAERQQLINEYENRLESSRNTIQLQERIIEEQRERIRLLENIRQRQDRELEKLSEA